MNVFVDCETTGRCEWRNDIITIALIVCDDEYNIVEEIDLKCKPSHDERYWSKEAEEEAHKIPMEEAYNYPNPKEVATEARDRILKHGKYNTFISHALPRMGSSFDHLFVKTWFWKHDMREDFYKVFGKNMTTQSNQHKATRDKYGIKDQKLGTWAEKLGIEFKWHTALDDTRLCREVFLYQRQFNKGLVKDDKKEKEIFT